MSGKVKEDVKRKPTRNARQYADRIARTATERADSTEPPLLHRLKGWFAMKLLEEIKTAADDLTADELEKVLQYIQTVKHRRTAE